jgi:hypothetical protein
MLVFLSLLLASLLALYMYRRANRRVAAARERAVARLESVTNQGLLQQEDLT